MAGKKLITIAQREILAELARLVVRNAVTCPKLACCYFELGKECPQGAAR